MEMYIHSGGNENNIIHFSNLPTTMSILAILDLVIGIIFVYFLLSIGASAVLEIAANFLKWRANDLRDWVYSTFDQPFNYKKKNFFERLAIRLKRASGKDDANKVANRCLGEEIWHHFAVDGLSKAGKKVSYIPSSEFVRALFDIIVNVDLLDDKKQALKREALFDEYGKLKCNACGKPYIDSVSNTKRNLATRSYSKEELGDAVLRTPYLSESQRDVILQFIRESDNVIEVRKNLEAWFDNAMERLTGGYKRFSQRFLLLTGLLICAALNVDTISLSTYLYENPEASYQLAQAATAAVKDTAYINAVERIERRDASRDTADVARDVKKIRDNLVQIAALKDSLNSLKLPIGWQHEKTKFRNADGSFNWGFNLLSKITGILLTGFALSLGATFWFDLLNKLVNLRAAGRKPGVIGVTKDDETVYG